MSTAVLIDRNMERDQFYQVWLLVEQSSAFDQTFAHQLELAAFQVAQATVYQFGRLAGCGPSRAVVLFQHDDPVTAGAGFMRHRCAVNAGTDNRQVIVWHACRRVV